MNQDVVKIEIFAVELIIMSQLVVVIAVELLLDVAVHLLDDVFPLVDDIHLEDILLHVLRFADSLDHLFEDLHSEEIHVRPEDTQDHQSEEFLAPQEDIHVHLLEDIRVQDRQCAGCLGLQCEDPRHLIIVEDLLSHVPLFVAGLLLTAALVPHHDIVMMVLLVTMIVLQDAFLLVVPLPDLPFLFLE